jgi:hypothetical protein
VVFCPSSHFEFERRIDFSKGMPPRPVSTSRKLHRIKNLSPIDQSLSRVIVVYKDAASSFAVLAIPLALMMMGTPQRLVVNRGEMKLNVFDRV